MLTTLLLVLLSAPATATPAYPNLLEREASFETVRAQWDDVEGPEAHLALLVELGEKESGIFNIPSSRPHREHPLDLAQDAQVHRWATTLAAEFDAAIREALADGRLATASRLSESYLWVHGGYYTNLEDNRPGCTSSDASCALRDLIAKLPATSDAPTDVLAMHAIKEAAKQFPVIRLVSADPSIDTHYLYREGNRDAWQTHFELPKGGYPSGAYMGALYGYRSSPPPDATGVVIDVSLEPHEVSASTVREASPFVADNPRYAPWAAQAAPLRQQSQDLASAIAANQSCTPGRWTTQITGSSTTDAVDYGDGTLYRAPTGQAATHSVTTHETAEVWSPPLCSPKDAAKQATLHARLQEVTAALTALGDAPPRQQRTTRVLNWRSVEGIATLRMQWGEHLETREVDFKGTEDRYSNSALEESKQHLVRKSLRIIWHVAIAPMAEEPPPWWEQVAPDATEAERQLELEAWRAMFGMSRYGGGVNNGLKGAPFTLTHLTQGYIDEQIRVHEETVSQCQQLKGPNGVEKDEHHKGQWVIWMDRQTLSFDSKRIYREAWWDPCVAYLEAHGLPTPAY